MMDDQISDKAKKALADNARRKAIDRLERDGAQSRPAMQRRILALAAERSIPPADYHKLMYKRPSTGAVLDFCKKHKVSFDWLMCGDLRGLQRMTRESWAQHFEQKDRVSRFMEKYNRLTPDQQHIVAATVEHLLEQRQ